MSVIRILMVEDDEAEAEAIKELVGGWAAARGIDARVTQEGGAFSLVDLAPAHDVVLLDIDLPGMSGIEAAEELRDHGLRTPLVFVTNLAQYAVHGYAVDATDFVVKPVSRASLEMALDKACRVAARSQGRTVTVRTRGETVVVPVERLVCVEVRGHDLIYREMGEDEPVVGHGTLADVERVLPADAFVRVSASCVANMGHIRRVRRDSVVMDDGTELWFSRRRRKEALERIAEWLGGTI